MIVTRSAYVPSGGENLDLGTINTPKIAARSADPPSTGRKP